jgi:hypothetical protein
MAEWVFPTSAGPGKMTFSLRVMKPSWCRFIIWARSMEAWKEKSKESRVLAPRRREERMAEMMRRSRRRDTWAESSCSRASAALMVPPSNCSIRASTTSRLPGI